MTRGGVLFVFFTPRSVVLLAQTALVFLLHQEASPRAPPNKCSSDRDKRFSVGRCFTQTCCHSSICCPSRCITQRLSLPAACAAQMPAASACHSQGNARFHSTQSCLHEAHVSNLILDPHHKQMTPKNI